MQTVMQLPLFIAPRDWASLINSGDADGPLDKVNSYDGGVMARKRQDLDEAFVDDIKECGVQRPLLIDAQGRLVLRDGHHRFTVAYDLNLPFVPVQFTSEMSECWASWSERWEGHCR